MKEIILFIILLIIFECLGNISNRLEKLEVKTVQIDSIQRNTDTYFIKK